MIQVIISLAATNAGKNKHGETRTSAKEKQVGSAGSLFRRHHKEGAASTRKGLEEKGVASFN